MKNSGTCGDQMYEEVNEVKLTNEKLEMAENIAYGPITRK